MSATDPATNADALWDTSARAMAARFGALALQRMRKGRPCREFARLAASYAADALGERPSMDRHEFELAVLGLAVREMRESAADYVRAYAGLHARHVAPRFLDAIVRALGDISIGEAVAALDRLEREGGGA